MKYILLIIYLAIFANIFPVPVASLTWLAAKSATSRFQQLQEICEYIADKEKSDDVAAHLAQAAVMNNEHLTCENKLALIKHIYLNRHRMWKSNEPIFRFLAYMLKNDIIPANEKAGKELYKLTSCNAIVPSPINHLVYMPLLHYIAVYHSSDILEWFLFGKGMNIQILNLTGMNALHEVIYWITENSTLEIIKRLLDAGIDTTLHGESGDGYMTPIELTQYKENLYSHDKDQVLRFQMIRDMINKINITRTKIKY